MLLRYVIRREVRTLLWKRAESIGSQYGTDIEQKGNTSMIALGKKQILKVIKIVEFGVYLAPEDGDGEEKVLLPIKQVPQGTQIGDKLTVFVYKDSKDRLISTTREPRLEVGQIAELAVVQVSKIGAFLDWGLEKDLLLPYREQTAKVEAGDICLVALYVDKSSRLCATMKVYEYLRQDSPYHKDDRVTGKVYEISKEFGAFVAVDNCYSALIPGKEVYGNIHVGDNITARVTECREDGKLNLSVREKAYIQMQTDAQKVMEAIESFDGVLPFNDKADPAVIRREMCMSKNEFKRAVGMLLKQGKIEIKDKAIRKL